MMTITCSMRNTRKKRMGKNKFLINENEFDEQRNWQGMYMKQIGEFIDDACDRGQVPRHVVNWCNAIKELAIEKLNDEC